MHFETFEHTADVGLRVRAAELDELFVGAAAALFSVIVANPDSIQSVQEIPIEIKGTGHEYLLFDWLAELLWTFDTRRIVFGSFEVHVDETGLRAVARGEPVDRNRHQMDAEIKAITYHQLKVERDADGWLAEVIVDV